MSNIRYDFAKISGAAQDIQSSAQRINGQLNDLKQGLQPMVNSWEGDAREAYYAHQQKWDQAAEDLNQILNQIAATVDEGNSQMMAVNNAAAQSWG